MTRDEAAARLRMSAREVTAVRQHPAGHVATLSAGRGEMLITATVARRYVPDVDDPAAEAEAEADAPAPKPRSGRSR